MRAPLALLAGLLGGVIGLGPAGCRRPDPPAPPIQDGPRCPETDPALGFHLVSWKDLGSAGPAAWRGAVEDLASHGIGHVSFAQVRQVDPETGALLAGEGSVLPPTAHLEAGLSRAAELGLRATVVPFVEPAGFSRWRGELGFSGIAAARFFAEYRAFVAEMAVLAQGGGAARLLIGTELRELVASREHRAAWTGLIDEAGDLFSGALGYAASWDDYRDPALTEVIWEHPRIDFLGVDAYFPVAKAEWARAQGPFPDHPFVSRVAQQWSRILDEELLPFAAALRSGNGLPVVLTEHGLVPFDGATVEPSSQAPAERGLADPDEQLAGYAGLLAALAGRGPQLLEVTFWHWGMPGAEGSRWFQHPDAVDAPDTPFDESLGSRAARYLTAQARGELTVLGQPVRAAGCTP